VLKSGFKIINFFCMLRKQVYLRKTMYEAVRDWEIIISYTNFKFMKITYLVENVLNLVEFRAKVTQEAFSVYDWQGQPLLCVKYTV